MECEYCKKIFGSKSSLSTHKKTAKYCLKIQREKGIIVTNSFKCNICLKEFSSKTNLKTHLQTICMENILKINDMLKDNQELKNNNEELKNRIIYLEEINNIYKSDHDCIKEIAKQPKNINNNTNKTLNLITPFNITDQEQIKNIVDNNYELKYIFSGQKGCAKFALENIIKDEQGNLKYICSDPSRYVYKFKDENGNIQKDVDAKKLTNLLVQGGLRKKACDMASEWWKDENGETDTGKFEMLIESAESIRTMDQDNTEFKKELAAMTSI